MTVLVAYASRHGGTRGIAESIAAELEICGHRAMFSDVSRVASLDGIDAVVLGSGVYVGRWLPAAREFMQVHQAELSAMPVWLFSSGSLGDQPTLEPTEVAGYTMIANVIDHTVFPGCLDTRNLGIGERLMSRVVGAPSGDYRDWAEIRAWAHRVGNQLSLLERSRVTVQASASAEARPVL